MAASPGLFKCKRGRGLFVVDREEADPSLLDDILSELFGVVAPARLQDEKDLPDFVIDLNVSEEEKGIDQHRGHLGGDPRGLDQFRNLAGKKGSDAPAFEIGDQDEQGVFILERILGDRFVEDDAGPVDDLEGVVPREIVLAARFTK